MARKRSTKSEEASKDDGELSALLKDIEEKRGEGIVYPASKLPNTKYLDTGIFVLDYLLFGGIPEGRTTMIYGNEGSGKSSMAASIVSSFQRKHGKDPHSHTAVWIDAESMFDPWWHNRLGVDCDKMLLVQPRTGQEGVDIVDAMMRTKEVGLIVIDSIPSLVPAAIIDRSAEDVTVAELARLVGTMCSKITAAWNDERRRGHVPTVIMINQWRNKIGVMFGDPRSLPGGKQINYHATCKIDIKKKENVPTKGDYKGMVVANEHDFKIAKHKGAWSQQGSYTMAMSSHWKDDYHLGMIDNQTTVATFAKKEGLITGGGASWKIHGVDNKFKSLDELRGYLLENEDEYLLLARKLMLMKRAEQQMPLLPPDGFILGKDLRKEKIDWNSG